ncbi:hypothetical protein XELAEV_18005106mg [Xenopus laevis]|uniref:Uncharacterized protein n=1 Tax=Xenopus laevis TaxID=8355 RepID=A0A974DWB6_XENLA|nr:hypothetical protein XELAEV_18005106mg [Xenopus laevis]
MKHAGAFRAIEEVRPRTYTNSLETVIFNVNKTTQTVIKDKLIIHILQAARMAIPKRWNMEEPPNKLDWVRELEETKTMEELLALKHGAMKQFGKIWSDWKDLQNT